MAVGHLMIGLGAGGVAGLAAFVLGGGVLLSLGMVSLIGTAGTLASAVVVASRSDKGDS